jgi:hypothetical protein
LANLASRFKHKAFQVEQEYRFICTDPVGKASRFRPGGFGVIPYVELAATHPSEFYVGKPRRALPIKAVMCGPFSPAERPSAIEAVRMLLTRYGYAKADVTASEAPYRFAG